MRTAKGEPVDKHDMKQVRALAQKLAKRVKTDQALKERIQNDPEGVLIAEGLPDHVINDFLRETGLADVSGYILNGLPLSQICSLTVS